MQSSTNTTTTALVCSAAVAVTAAVACRAMNSAKRFSGAPVENKFDLKGIVRPNIWSLEAYRCARDDYSEGILLDANENSHGPSVDTSNFVGGLERYPSPYQYELKQLVSDYRGVEPNQVFLGVGSDEVIDILFRIFCAPGRDNIIITPPTYGMYKVSACINDTEIIKVPLTSEFELQPEKVLAAVTPNTRLIFLCHPGNPTSKLLRERDMLRLLAPESGYRGIVVVDEAYIDFSEGRSMAKFVKTYPNLVVTQTLSKAFGLAGIRLGMALASDSIVSIMNKVKAPYNVSALSSQVGRAAFEPSNLAKLKITLGTILQQRGRVEEALRAMPGVGRVHPSDSNFILFQVIGVDAKRLYKDMAAAGVVVRYRGMEQHCASCLRVTIGTEGENDKFLQLLGDFLGAGSIVEEKAS